MTERTCETCRWWAKWADGTLDSGQCHRRAPTETHKIVVAGRTYTGAFPFVSSVAWCGEHTPKEPTP